MAKGNSRFSPFLKQCFVTSAVGFNLIGHGSLTGFPAVLLPQLYEPDSVIVSNKTADSWIASAISITLLLGSFLTPPIMGRFGRKTLHFVISAFAVLGWIITVVAWNVELILLSRIIGGLSFGMMLPLRSILIGEYTSPKHRGAFLTTISVSQGSGIFLIHLIGSILSWRKTALVFLFLPLTSLIMTFFTPESPSWLVSKGKYEKCREVFRWLRGDDEEEELEAMIQARIHFEKAKAEEKKVDIFGSIRKPEFYKPITLMLHVYIIAQLSGAAVFATFSTVAIKLIMNPDVRADMWMIILDTERILINTIAIFIINKVKRRTMLFSAAGLCIFTQLAIAAYVYSRNSGLLTYDILWIPSVLLILQFSTISAGMVPLPSVIAGEVFPLQYRSIAGTISLISISGSMFLVLKTFGTLVDNIGLSGAYVVYSIMLTYCMIVIWFLLPETKDRTLQDIEDEYRGIKRKDVTTLQELQPMKGNENRESESKKEIIKDTL